LPPVRSRLSSFDDDNISPGLYLDDSETLTNRRRSNGASALRVLLRNRFENVRVVRVARDFARRSSVTVVHLETQERHSDISRRRHVVRTYKETDSSLRGG